MLTACKKEEKSALTLLRKDIYFNGKVGDMYENPIDGYKVFFIKEFTKTNQKPRLEDLKYNYVESGVFF